MMYSMYEVCKTHIYIHMLLNPRRVLHYSLPLTGTGGVAVAWPPMLSTILILKSSGGEG